MRGPLEAMFIFKPHVTDIMFGNNEIMSSVYSGYIIEDLLYKRMVHLFSSLYKMSYIFQNVWSTYSI
jgi:hypothetical protein